MTKRVVQPVTISAGLILAAALALITAGANAQDRLKAMPGYEQFQRVGKELQGAYKSGALGVTWKDDSTAFEYARDGRLHRFDLATMKATDVGEAPATPAAGRGGRGGRGGEGVPPPPQQVQGRGQVGGPPERGRQVASVLSPNGRLRASYRPADQNLYLADADGANEVAVTTDGSRDKRIKNGTASWVYGEELSQTTAMWWSPDSSKLAYYRFDESAVPDYHLQIDQTRLYSRVDIEAYPKAGQPNPLVDLYVYDVPAKKSIRVDVRDGRPFENNFVGYYVYHVQWSPDGTELLFNRTNRRQNVLEVVAADPRTGTCRVVVRDEWPTGWVENNPQMVFLNDGRRFLFASERNGWKNFYLYDLGGKLLNPVTSYTGFEAGTLVKVDEQRGVVFVTARDGDNYMKLQLHRVGLDGKGDTRLTDPALHHSVGGCMAGVGGGRGMGGGFGLAGGSCGISPDNRYFVDVYQTHRTAPATRLVEASGGKVVAELATSDLAAVTRLGFRPPEMFAYKAADGKTELRGLVTFPSNFDPTRKYPALVSVYGGPAAAQNCARETYSPPNAMPAEYGFLVLNLDTRATPGMGKRQLDALYQKLGQTEMDDMAEGVKALWNRPYFDRSRVGIYGTSYGGYSALMCVLRHPDVFQAGSSSSPVTSWSNYDTIYTERYMWVPEENKAGYDAGSAMTYSDRLNGRLLIYYGTADNNVHPTNAMQLIQALQRAGKSFEVQVGPDAGHSGVNAQRMMEFFIDNLVVRQASPVPAKPTTGLR